MYKIFCFLRKMIFTTLKDAYEIAFTVLHLLIRVHSPIQPKKEIADIYSNKSI